MAIDSLSAAGAVANAAPPARSADAAAASAPPQPGPPSAAAKTAPAAAEPSLADLKKAVSSVQQAVEAKSSNLSFVFAKDAGTTVLQLTDKQSGDVILQIPSKAVIALADLIDKPGGMFVEQKI